MLIEVKAKVARVIDGKTRKKVESFVLDRELFSEAEYAVLSKLTTEQQEGLIESSEILSLRQSPIKEVATQFISGDYSYLATLIDIWLDNDGTEKKLKYKVLLWANSLTEANANASQLARQGYDMQIEGIKQVDYEYLNELSETTNTEDEPQNDN